MDNKLETAGNPEQSSTETGWEGVAAMADDFQANKSAVEAGTQQLEAISQPEAVLSADNNVYREIAKNALMNWNGMSPEEADESILNSSVEDLESQVYAQGSIKEALSGINKALEMRKRFSEDGNTLSEARLFYEVLSSDKRENNVDEEKLFDAVLNSEKDSDVFKDLGEKLKGVEDKENFALDVLSVVHEGWIKNNLKKLNDPNRVGKRYQFMPLEFIGIDEAKADLIFVEPIFKAAGMEIDEAKLGYKYARYKKFSECFNRYTKDGLKDEFYDHASSDYIDGIKHYGIEATDKELYSGVKQVDQYFRYFLPSDFKIDFSNVENKQLADKYEHEWQKQLIYAAEVSDQVCNKLNK